MHIQENYRDKSEAEKRDPEYVPALIRGTIYGYSQGIITIPLHSVGAMNGAERNADDSMASENIVFRVINRPQVNNISYRFPV